MNRTRAKLLIEHGEPIRYHINQVGELELRICNCKVAPDLVMGLKRHGCLCQKGTLENGIFKYKENKKK